MNETEENELVGRLMRGLYSSMKSVEFLHTPARDIVVHSDENPEDCYVEHDLAAETIFVNMINEDTFQAGTLLEALLEARGENKS